MLSNLEGKSLSSCYSDIPRANPRRRDDLAVTEGLHWLSVRLPEEIQAGVEAEPKWRCQALGVWRWDNVVQRRAGVVRTNSRIAENQRDRGVLY